MRQRRNFTRDFKLSILSELSVKSMAEVCREHKLHPVMVQGWKKQYHENPEKAFSGKGSLWKPEAEVAKYERLVGKLYAENEFLKKTIRSLQELQVEEEKRRLIR
ncbi:MAG: transposase [Nanoarchaeota archaeon]